MLPGKLNLICYPIHWSINFPGKKLLYIKKKLVTDSKLLVFKLNINVVVKFFENSQGDENVVL